MKELEYAKDLLRKLIREDEDKCTCENFWMIQASDCPYCKAREFINYDIDKEKEIREENERYLNDGN